MMFYSLWNPRQKTWVRTYSGELLWWPELRLVYAYLLNHPPLPHKWEVRRITPTGEPDLQEEYPKDYKLEFEDLPIDK
jgi:hypothetical protein